MQKDKNDQINNASKRAYDRNRAFNFFTTNYK